MRPDFIAFVAVAVLATASAFAQKDGADSQESYGIFETQGEYHDFMGAVKSDPEMDDLVPMINDLVLQRDLGWTAQTYGTPGNSLGLLGDAEVRGDLEMLDYQYEELQQKNAEIQRKAAEQIRGLDLSDMAKVAEQVRRIQASTVEQMRAGLLPHQLERLEQISAQSQLRHRSLVDIITSDPVKTNLEITDEQSEELKRAEQQVEEQLQRQIAELRAQAREQLLESLGSDQREKVDEMFGESFSFSTNRQPRNSQKRAEQKQGWKKEK